MISIEEYFVEGNKYALVGSSRWSASFNDIDVVLFTNGVKRMHYNFEYFRVVENHIIEKLGLHHMKLDFISPPPRIGTCSYDIFNLPIEDDFLASFYLSGDFYPNCDFLKEFYLQSLGVGFEKKLFQRVKDDLEFSEFSENRLGKERQNNILLEEAKKRYPQIHTN